MRFTVLTPTFNRARTLPRVFASLCAQTFRDFEWLIVDDGSTDETESLVSSWRADFPIRCLWQPNRGKHTAVNFGVGVARGFLIAQLDSDDELLPRALEIFDQQWSALDNRFAAAVGLCVDDHGIAIGKPYPGAYADSFSLRESNRLVAGAERFGVIRADIWRQFPSPEFPGERFIPEGVFQSQILARHAARYFNEPVRIYHRSGDSISKTDWRKTSPRGALLFHRMVAFTPGLPIHTRLKSAINALRFATAVRLQPNLLRSSVRPNTSTPGR